MRKPLAIQTKKPEIERAIGEVRDVVNLLVDSLFPDAALVTGIHLANATTYRLRHGLSHPLRGWFVVDLTGPASTGRIERIIPSATNIYDPGTEVWLQANGYGATVTVSLVVF